MLVDQVLEAPDDDAPRLVYADSLANERGELITIQCALARAGIHQDSDLLEVPELGRLPKLVRRQNVLLDLHANRWRREAGVPHGSSFARGFVEEIVCSPDEPVAIETIASSPVRRLIIEALDDAQAERLIATDTPSLQLLIVERPLLSKETFARLLRSKPSIRHLRVFGIAPDLSSLPAQLETLALKNSEITADDLTQLHRASPRLRTLSLAQTMGLGDAALVALEWNLDRLAITWGNVTSDGLERAATRGLRLPRSFDLAGNYGVGAEGIRAMLRMSPEALEELEVGAVIDPMVVELGKLPRLKQLRIHGAITDEGIRALGGQLSTLEIERARLTGDGVSTLLMNHPTLERFAFRAVDEETDGPAIARALAAAASLRVVELRGVPCRDSGARHFAASKRLRRLILGDAAIEDASVLLDAPMPELVDLGLEDNAVIESGNFKLPNLVHLRGSFEPVAEDLFRATLGLGLWAY